VERLWRLEGHRVPPRRTQASGKKAQGLAVNAIWNLTATRPNQIWSYDFMGGRLRNGTPIRILNIVDEFTREALACRVDRSISSADVIAELRRLFEERGTPEMMRSDNGREFIAATLVNWLVAQGVTAVFIEKGSPQQKAYALHCTS
jgi:transposase InsO family protein